MNGTTALPRRSFGETMRADVWWVQPLLVFIGLSTFIVYSTWAAFQGKDYFFYLALLFILILAYDVWKALWFVDPATGKNSFGIGVGTIVLAINVYLLSGYTFGCHSLRHLIGGFRDQLAKSPTCYRAYACVSCLNRRHMLWAWLSLFWVGFADLYVRLCAMGIWHDWRIV